MPKPVAHWPNALAGFLAIVVGLSACKMTPRQQASPYLQSVLNDLSEIPDIEPLTKLTPEDGKIALEIYTRTPQLLDRRALVWALGYAGDEKAVEALIFSLTREFSGKHLTSEIEEETTDEEYVLLNAVTALGFLASKYDSAFAFLLKGTEDAFWKESKRWSSERSKLGNGSDFSVEMLVGYCIQGLGQSGRHEVPSILQKLKKRIANTCIAKERTSRKRPSIIMSSRSMEWNGFAGASWEKKAVLFGGRGKELKEARNGQNGGCEQSLLREFHKWQGLMLFDSPSTGTKSFSPFWPSSSPSPPYSSSVPVRRHNCSPQVLAFAPGKFCIASPQNLTHCPCRRAH